MFEIFKKVRRQIELHFYFLSEVFVFWRMIVKYNASNHTDDDIQKMQYTLLRETHTLEKGMSMRNPRHGYGQQKVSSLINRLKKYCSMYLCQDSEFLKYPISTIHAYIEYTHNTGVEIPCIDKSYEELLKMSGVKGISSIAGVKTVYKDDLLDSCKKDFESLLLSRHSLRYFSDEPVTDELIYKALKLAQKTPSACNRQGWLTHVFKGSRSVDLIKWQAGCNGFEDEIRYSILVTANLKAFIYHEIHQAYIDGALYAMNLINVLHYLGLGTIPLSCGFGHKHIKGLAKFDIPENEVPIVIIGFGNLLPSFKVAISERKDIEKTNTFHN